MDFRTYQITDCDGCLAVFDSNTSDTAARASFRQFLQDPQGTYFVLDHDGVVAGCGGYTVDNAETASITWLMVGKGFHRNGLGRFLLYGAMRKLSAEADPTLLRVVTSASAGGFFEKQGFRVSTSSGEMVELVKKLKVCS